MDRHEVNTSSLDSPSGRWLTTLGPVPEAFMSRRVSLALPLAPGAVWRLAPAGCPKAAHEAPTLTGHGLAWGELGWTVGGRPGMWSRTRWQLKGLRSGSADSVMSRRWKHDQGGVVFDLGPKDSRFRYSWGNSARAALPGLVLTLLALHRAVCFSSSSRMFKFSRMSVRSRLFRLRTSKSVSNGATIAATPSRLRSLSRRAH